MPQTHTSSAGGSIHMRQESPREVVDRIIAEKMKSNPTATAPGHLNRIVWSAIEDDTDLVKAFVSDCTNVGYERAVERERVAAGGKPTKVTIVNVGGLVPRKAPHTMQPAPAMSADQVASAQSKGRDKFAKAISAIEQMRFANGKGILDQTVAEIQQLGGFATGILRALPRHAKPTDSLRALGLTIEQVTKLRTFNV